MSKTTFEKLGIPYEERDGIFYPVLVAGTEKADIEAGKYGRMWIKYIREEYPMRYKSLVRFGELEERADGVRKQQIDLEGIAIPEIHSLSDTNVARVDESVIDVTGKSEFVEPKEKEPIGKVDWIVRRISDFGGFENVSDSVKADVFGFDIADISGSIRLFSDVMKRLEIKLAGDELYEEFQRIYDESVDRDASKDKAEDKMWNRGRGR